MAWDSACGGNQSVNLCADRDFKGYLGESCCAFVPSNAGKQKSRSLAPAFSLKNVLESVGRTRILVQLSDKAGDATEVAVTQITDADTLNFMDHVEAVAQLAISHGRNRIVVGTQAHHFGVQEVFGSNNFGVEIVQAHKKPLVIIP
ncbi:MAG: hypothetical protein RLZZ519_3482 [Bacteroidota bacterium]|jgi:hypothetical protein